MSSPQKPSVASCDSSYCHAHLLGRCRTEQGSLPRRVDLEGFPSSQLATKAHSHQIPTFEVILARHSNQCVLVDFPETLITEGYKTN